MALVLLLVVVLLLVLLLKLVLLKMVPVIVLAILRLWAARGGCAPASLRCWLCRWPWLCAPSSDLSSLRLYGMALKVLVHDYGGGPDDTFNKMLRNAYLSRGGTALLTVDWSALAAARCGRKFAELQTELVGACTARVLAVGAGTGALPPPERLHALGAGLGAHIAALTAACLPGGHIGRLTALDPTPVPVQRSQAGGDSGLVSAPLLDVDAALQVDVLHTTSLTANACGIGDPRPAGHVDIYISCGQSVQPFCYRSSDPGKCSHELAVAYFAEGVYPGPGLRAVPCGDLCRRNISLPDLPPAEAARLTAYAVPVGEDLPFTATGILCAEASSRPPFGRKSRGGGGLNTGGGHLCWALSGAAVLYLLARTLARRAQQS